MPENDPAEELQAPSDVRRQPPSYDAAKEGYAGISSGALSSIEGLHDARAFAEMIVDTVREGLLVLDFDLRVQAANESFYRVFGVWPEDTVGRLVYDLGDGQWDLPELRELLEDVLPHERAFDDFEVEHEFGGGGRRVMLLNARRLDDHHLILLAIEDVTERRQGEEQQAQAEVALRESEERFRLLVDNAHEYAIFSMDEGNRITMWNAGAERILGWSREEALGMPGAMIFTEEDRAAGVPEHELARAVAAGSTLDERWHVRKDGRRFWASGMMVALEDGSLRGFAKILRDNTERKETEEALRRASKTDRFRAALGDALRPLTDPLEVQAEAARLLGLHLGASRVHYAEMEADGEHAGAARDYARTAPNRAGRYRMADFATLHAETRAGRTFVGADVAADPRLSDDEKAVFAALPAAAIVVVPLVKGGRLAAVLAVHRAAPHGWTDEEVALVEEVAERTWAAVEQARAEEALRHLNATLEARVAERTEQVRELSRALTLAEQRERQRIAHVLHEDLQQVLFGAQMAASAGDSERLNGILDDAVDLTRSLAHELSPPLLQGEDLEDLLRWVAERTRAQYGLEVEVEAGRDVPVPDPALRVLLYQVVRELLFNVAKHAGTKRARLVAERADDHVRLVVEDAGVGFDPAALEAAGAVGLGLPSVWERVELVGGRLAIESEPGAGTRVTITVPVPGMSTERGATAAPSH